MPTTPREDVPIHDPQDDTGVEPLCPTCFTPLAYLGEMCPCCTAY